MEGVVVTKPKLDGKPNDKEEDSLGEKEYAFQRAVSE